MKKIFKVLLVLLLLVIVLTALVYDFTKVRETPIEEVKSIAENRENQKIAGDMYVYSIKEENNKVYITRYGNMDVISLTYIYTFENNVVNKINVEEHFDRKITAIMYKRDYTNRKLKGNIVTGEITQSDLIGKDKETLINIYKDMFDRFDMYELK
mgnify:FL=1